MTLKVVNISGGSKVVEPAPKQAPNRSESNQGQTQVAGTAAASAVKAASSEAALTNVRSIRSASVSSEKIKEYKEAKALTQDVADRVSEGSSNAKEAHSVSEGSARAHLLQ